MNTQGEVIMAEEPLARRLHDRATRGGVLTAAEQAHLEAWYEQQDRGEAALLAQTAQSPATIQSLRSEVDEAVARLLALTQRVQGQADENEVLRRDIAALYQRLAQAPQWAV